MSVVKPNQSNCFNQSQQEQNRTKHKMNQSEVEANASNKRLAQENACEQVTLGFGFTSNLRFYGLESGASFF